MNDELVERVRESLTSRQPNPSIDFRLIFTFESLAQNPVDLTKHDVTLMVVAEPLEITDLLGQIGPGLGRLYPVRIPYSSIPELLADSRVKEIILDD